MFVTSSSPIHKAKRTGKHLEDVKDRSFDFFVTNSYTFNVQVNSSLRIKAGISKPLKDHRRDFFVANSYSSIAYLSYSCTPVVS